MKSILFSVLAFLSFTASYGQSFPASIYSAFSIPDSMKKNVDGVYRLDEQVMQIRSPSRYISKEHVIFTILNESGAAHLNCYEVIDKFDAVTDIEVKIYDASGREVKRYKKRDFTIQTAYDGVSLVTDNKVMFIEAPSPGYPCTIETMITRDVTGYISLPSFNVSNIDHSVESFRFVVEVPAALDIRHRVRNLSLQPAISTVGENKVYTWQGAHLVGRTIPKNGFAGSKYASMIDIAPNSFEYDGYPGTFKDWKTFGEWSAPFYVEKTPFSDARVAEIKQMVSTCKTDAEKIGVLYNYLKKNMRYVSIQLGIGGFKPFPASFVDSKKYGDCKALTNYMHHMLNVVGIKSYPALINASYDSPPVELEFPANRFNHVILCVPQAKDSIWLECTSNISTAGFLGSFTENKKALLLTQNGGILVSTPRSNSKNSRLITKTEIDVSEDGSAIARRSIFCSGDEKELFDYVRQMNNDDKRSNLVKRLNYRVPDDYLLTFKGDSLNGYSFDFAGAYGQLYDFKAGSKMFFPQTVSRISNEELKMDTARKIEYLFDHPYERIDTTVLLLPKTMGIETLLPAKSLTTDIATYRFETSYDESSNKLQVISHIVLRENQVPASHYQALASFFSAVNRNQDQKIVVRMRD